MRDEITPAGLTTSATGDRPARRDLPNRGGDDRPDQQSREKRQQPTAPVPEPPLDSPGATIPGILFAASLLGQTPGDEDTASPIETRRERWSPPDSELHLKDSSA